MVKRSQERHARIRSTIDAGDVKAALAELDSLRSSNSELLISKQLRLSARQITGEEWRICRSLRKLSIRRRPPICTFAICLMASCPIDPGNRRPYFRTRKTEAVDCYLSPKSVAGGGNHEAWTELLRKQRLHGRGNGATSSERIEKSIFGPRGTDSDCSVAAGRRKAAGGSPRVFETGNADARRLAT